MGAGLAIGSGTVVLLYSLSEWIAAPSPKLGALVYFVLPCVLVVGVVLYVAGRRGAVQQGSSPDEAPPSAAPSTPDGEPPVARSVLPLLIPAVLAVALLTLASVQAVRFSSSLPFCAQACHAPMEPTFAAFRASPHADISCAECHVGAGASGFVASKVSGLREAWAMTGGTYERPIVATADELPRAAETCQRCHPSPEAPSLKPRHVPIFRPDEANTAEQLTLTMVSSASPGATDGNTGIDWHHNLDNTVTYVALDEQAQRIPWVSVRRWDGNVTEYAIADEPLLDAAGLATLPRRQLDCVGCHNRTGHRFEPPAVAVNRALAEGELPASLPWVKRAVMDALVEPFASRAEARLGVTAAIETFYRERQPELLTTRRADVTRAAERAGVIVDQSLFPAMGVDWQSYPDNSGHLHWPGCFRCHDDRHRSTDGRVLSKSCTLCHSAPSRSPSPSATPASPNDWAWHPWDMPAEHVEVKAHHELACHQCHQPERRPRSACEDCHR